MRGDPVAPDVTRVGEADDSGHDRPEPVEQEGEPLGPERDRRHHEEDARYADPLQPEQEHEEQRTPEAGAGQQLAEPLDLELLVQAGGPGEDGRADEEPEQQDPQPHRASRVQPAFGRSTAG